MRLDHFSAAVQNVVQCFEDNKIDYLFVLTPLLPNNGEAISHPFINQDLLSYNQVLSKYRSVDLNSSDIKWIMSDYQDGTVHFTEQGHQKIHASLMPFISQSSYTSALLIMNLRKTLAHFLLLILESLIKKTTFIVV